MNTGVCGSFGTDVLGVLFCFVLFFGWGIYPGVELLGHMVALNFPGDASGKEPTC